MDVSGELQRHSGAQPCGHVPFTGATQVAVIVTGPSISQQISPEPQQVFPQQLPPVQVVVHGSWVHTPALQSDFNPVHWMPHAPQFRGSLFVLTQFVAQQVRSGPHI
jgi:hypothetical protein